MIKEIGSFWPGIQAGSRIMADLNDRRSFYDHSLNKWATITYDHDLLFLENMSHIHLMIMIWSEKIGDHDQITPSLGLG